MAIFVMISKNRTPSVTKLILLCPARYRVCIGTYLTVRPERKNASVNVVG